MVTVPPTSRPTSAEPTPEPFQDRAEALTVTFFDGPQLRPTTPQDNRRDRSARQATKNTPSKQRHMLEEHALEVQGFPFSVADVQHPGVGSLRVNIFDEDPDEESPKPSKIVDRWDGFSPGPIPVAPDGGIAAGAPELDPTPIPPATPETFICLRGPCRHYYELKSFADVEGPRKGKLEEPYQYISRVCTVQPGVETESTDTVIYHCNRWEPIPVTMIVRRFLLRGQYSLMKSLNLLP